jgi:GDP-L-fucose synthase
MQKDAKIYVAGHRGLAGSAICRALERQGYANIITRAHAELDLCDQAATNAFFRAERPDYVFLAAAKVGGIAANDDYAADFIMRNLMIEINVINACFENGVKRLLFLGSSCIYPRGCPQPIKEEYLLTGPLERTNEAYAVAKIAGVKMCHYLNKQYATRYLSVMPCNLYGPNDNYDAYTSHVLPALLRKTHEAKRAGAVGVEVWGTGEAQREFLHADDAADACLFLMENYFEDDIINVGSGSDITIRGLAELVKKVVGFTGELRFDTSRPDGTPRKLLDCSKLFAAGWRPKYGLEDGVRDTYDRYLREEAWS